MNRFYTVEFFRETSRKLTPSGLLSFQLRSSENYISPELGQFLRSIHKSLLAVFPEVTAIPGETIHFFAARQSGVLASGADELLARLRARHLETSYVSEYFIPSRMTPDRMADMDTQLRPLPATPVNRDFAPVAYYFDVALWSSQFNQGYRRLFRAMAEISFETVLATVGVVLALLVAGGRLRWGGHRIVAGQCEQTGDKNRSPIPPRRATVQLAAGFCTAATGFTMIGLEMLLLLAFQAVYGYVYQQLAVLIAAFMAGVALGSWLELRRAAHGGMRALAITQVLAAAAPLLLVGLLRDNRVGQRRADPAREPECIPCPGAGFRRARRIRVCGCEPDLLCRDRDIEFCSPSSRHALCARSGGSCLGAVLLSAWFVPVFGFLKTALLSAHGEPGAGGHGPAADSERFRNERLRLLALAEHQRGEAEKIGVGIPAMRAPGGRPCRQTSSSNVARSQFSSVATWGSNKPSWPLYGSASRAVPCGSPEHPSRGAAGTGPRFRSAGCPVRRR